MFPPARRRIVKGNVWRSLQTTSKYKQISDLQSISIYSKSISIAFHIGVYKQDLVLQSIVIRNNS